MEVASERMGHESLFELLGSRLGFELERGGLPNGFPFLRDTFIKALTNRPGTNGEVISLEDAKLAADKVEAHMRAVRSPEEMLKAANVFHQWCYYGLNLEPTKDRLSRTILLFDRVEKRNNIISAYSEVVVPTAGGRSKRPDIVVFANGIPIVVIEMKAAWVGLKAAKKQQTAYQGRGAIPFLYSTVALTLVCSQSEGMLYGTPGCEPSSYVPRRAAAWEAFPDLESSEWKRDTLLLLRPDFLIDFIHEGILPQFRPATEEYAAVESRIVLRPHQFDALCACRGAATISQGGFVSHTMAAGKTFLMAALARWGISQDFDRVVNISDRKSLEWQTKAELQTTGLNFRKARTSGELIELLRSGEPLVMAMIYKFNPDRLGMPSEADDEDEDDGIGAFSDGIPQFTGKSLIIVDEAHRTQAGRLHASLRAMFPGQPVIGVTGTPVTSGPSATHLVFGKCLHGYDRVAARRDEIIVDVAYESRVSIFGVKNPQALDAMARRYIEDARLKPKDARRVGSAVANLESFSLTDIFITTIAKDVAETMAKEPALRPEFRPDGTRTVEGNAMIATESIEQAFLFYDKLRGMMPPGDVRIVTSYVPTSDGQRTTDADENSIRRWELARETLGYGPEDQPTNAEVQRRADDYVRKTEQLCSKKPEQARLVITVNMLTVGFNARPLTYLFLCRRNRDHALLQLIGRIERTFAEKKRGVIIDYLGVLQEIEDAYRNQHVATLRNQQGDPGLDENGQPLPEAFAPFTALSLNAARVQSMRASAAALERHLEPLRFTGDALHDFDEVIRPFYYPGENHAAEPKFRSRREEFYRLCRDFGRAMNEFRLVVFPAREGVTSGELERWPTLRNFARAYRPAIEIGSGDRVDVSDITQAIRARLGDYITARGTHVLQPRDADGLLDAIHVQTREDAIALLAEEARREKEEEEGDGLLLTVKACMHRTASVSESSDKVQALSSLLGKMLEEGQKRHVELLQKFLLIQERQNEENPERENTSRLPPVARGYPGRAALFELLGSEEVFDKVFEEAQAMKQGWRRNPMKERGTEKAIREVLEEAVGEAEAERLFSGAMEVLKRHESPDFV